MNASLRTLLSGVIDYAGLFPPATLPLDQAIRNYADYRGGPDAWMLGRFVIPAVRLRELDAFAGLFLGDPPFSFALLGRGDDARIVRGVTGDCRQASEFCERHPGRVRVDVCEVRLPTGYNSECIPLAAERLGPQGWSLFWEGRVAADGAQSLLAALARVAASRAEPEPPRPLAPCGFKLRCGGPGASAFPSVEHLAFVVRACRDAGVPLKFTAGLHHPIRHFDAGVQTHMHGFINVFVAGVLAHARGLGEETLRAVIADEDAVHFAFTDDGLSWKDHRASTAEIAAARREFVTSFGSCSFDEPRAELRALGWL